MKPKFGQMEEQDEGQLPGTCNIIYGQICLPFQEKNDEVSKVIPSNPQGVYGLYYLQLPLSIDGTKFKYYNMYPVDLAKSKSSAAWSACTKTRNHETKPPK